MPPKKTIIKKVKEDIIDPFVEKELLYESLKFINNNDILNLSKQTFYIRDIIKKKLDKSILDTPTKNIYTKLLKKLTFLSSNPNVEKSKFSGNAIIYRASHLGQIKDNFPTGLSISKSNSEPIYFSTSYDYVKPYCDMSGDKTNMRIFEYELADEYIDTNKKIYYLFVNFSIENKNTFDIDLLNDIYEYIFEKYQLLIQDEKFVKLTNSNNYGLGLVSETKKLYMSIFGCVNKNNNDTSGIGKKCSIHGIDKMVAIQFNRLFKEFEDYCNLVLRQENIDKEIKIIGYYHDKILSTDPMYPYFHPELIIQMRYLKKEERINFLFKIKEHKC